VEPYVALQTDELTLEPPEIINVLRKINEGTHSGARSPHGSQGAGFDSPTLQSARGLIRIAGISNWTPFSPSFGD